MKPSSANAKTSHTRARNALLLNLLATPGLGSLLAGRKLAGLGQLLLSIAGFLLVVIWFVDLMRQYYGQMFNEQTTHAQFAGGLLIGGGLFAVAWVWSLFTSLSLLRAAGAEGRLGLEALSADVRRLSEPEIGQALAALSAWERDGQQITRTFEFVDFPAAIRFVNALAEAAEAAQHHPDVDIRWNKVTLTLTTHDAGGLTEKDFSLARQLDALAAKH